MPFVWRHGVLSRRASPHQCGMQPSDFPDHQLRIIDTSTCRLQVRIQLRSSAKQRGAALHLDPAEVAHGRTQWAVSGELRDRSRTQARRTPWSGSLPGLPDWKQKLAQSTPLGAVGRGSINHANQYRELGATRNQRQIRARILHRDLNTF
jgi:hypothetical protein